MMNMESHTIHKADKTEELFYFCFNRNAPIIDALSSHYPRPYLDLMDTYVAHRCINIHHIFLTSTQCFQTGIDICSANAFLRIIADHIAILYLIYDNQDSEEIQLRHYLSIADGINTQVKVLQDLIQKDTINSFKKCEATKIIENESKNLEICINTIKALAIYNSCKETIDCLLKKYNWKYKKLSDYNRKKENECTYKMYELYRDKLMIKNDYISYLSNHIHGLAGSVTTYINEESILMVKTIVTFLIVKYSNFLRTYFKIKPSELEMDFYTKLTAEITV